MPPDQLNRLTEAFHAGSESGNLEHLLNLLQEDVVFLSDGGGKVVAAKKPIYGKSNIGKFLVGIHSQMPADTQIEVCRINETIGLIFRDHSDKINTVMSIEFSAQGLIKSFYTVRNPDKLRHLGNEK